jgi:hypothetical protein
VRSTAELQGHEIEGGQGRRATPAICSELLPARAEDPVAPCSREFGGTIFVERNCEHIRARKFFAYDRFCELEYFSREISA